MTLHLAESGSNDALPSWSEGPAKLALLDFIQRVSADDSPELVPGPERVAAFGAAGVLWPARPHIEAHFALTRIKFAAELDPSLRTGQPFETALAGDLHGLSELNSSAALDLIARSHAHLRQDQFEQQVADF